MSCKHKTVCPVLDGKACQLDECKPDAFKQDETETPVIFRKYGPRKGGDVLALFPAEIGTYDSATCSSYAHVGQHGSASPYGVIGDTRPATPEEYADLKKELECAPYGYKLKVYTRMQPAFDKARRDEAERLRKRKS